MLRTPSVGIKSAALELPWISSKNCIEPLIRFGRLRTAGPRGRTRPDDSCFGDFLFQSSIRARIRNHNLGCRPRQQTTRLLGKAAQIKTPPKPAHNLGMSTRYLLE